jgi:hypothetical protein
MAGRPPGGPDQAGPSAGGRRPAAVHVGGRVYLRYPVAGGARRAGRAARGRDERNPAARRARLPGADGGARALRLRVRDQVGHRHRGHHVRGGALLLGAARLGAAGADQDRVPDRRASGRRLDRRRQDAGRGRGLGAAQGHRRGRGASRRRPVAPGAARRGARHRHLAAVGAGMGRHARAPPARGPCHRRDRLHADRRPGPAGPERRHRLPLGSCHRPRRITDSSLSRRRNGRSGQN